TSMPNSFCRISIIGWAFWMTRWASSAGTNPTRKILGALEDRPQPTKLTSEISNARTRWSRFILVLIDTERPRLVQPPRLATMRIWPYSPRWKICRPRWIDAGQELGLLLGVSALALLNLFQQLFRFLFMLGVVGELYGKFSHGYEELARQSPIFNRYVAFRYLQSASDDGGIESDGLPQVVEGLIQAPFGNGTTVEYGGT